MIPTPNHLNDDVLSALIDQQLEPAEAAAAQAHIDTCAACAARLAELRSVVGLLRQLPEVELPRDFSLGPRVVADPPNVIRLQRFYTWTRAASASLAAVFVFLVAGTVYIDTTAPRARATVAFAPAPAAPAAPAVSAPPAAAGAPATGASALSAAAPPTAAAPTTAPAAVRDAASGAGAAAPAARAPAAAQAPAPAPAAAQAPAPAPPPQQAAKPAAENAVSSAAESQDTAEQTAAATTVRALPTPQPSVAPTVPAVAVAKTSSDTTRVQFDDPAAAWRLAASAFGVLAALALLITFVFRHRLRRARTSVPLIPQE